MAVGDGKLGKDWTEDLAQQNVRTLSHADFSPSLVQQSGIEVLLLDDRLPSRSSSICTAPSPLFVVGTSLPLRGIVGPILYQSESSAS